MSATPATVQAVTDALQRVVDPNTGRAFGKAIEHVTLADGTARGELVLGYPARSQHAALQALLADAARSVPGVQALQLDIRTDIIPTPCSAACSCCPA